MKSAEERMKVAEERADAKQDEIKGMLSQIMSGFSSMSASQQVTVATAIENNKNVSEIENSKKIHIRDDDPTRHVNITSPTSSPAKKKSKEMIENNEVDENVGMETDHQGGTQEENSETDETAFKEVVTPSRRNGRRQSEQMTQSPPIQSPPKVSRQGTRNQNRYSNLSEDPQNV